MATPSKRTGSTAARRMPRAEPRGTHCECCSGRLKGQGVILLDGHRKLYLCRGSTEDAWARRDAVDATQGAILEYLWQLPPWQGDADDLGTAGTA